MHVGFPKCETVVNFGVEMLKFAKLSSKKGVSRKQSWIEMDRDGSRWIEMDQDGTRIFGSGVPVFLSWGGKGG